MKDSINYIKMLMEGRIWKYIVTSFKDDKIKYFLKANMRRKLWEMYHKKCYVLTPDDYFHTIHHTHYQANINPRLNLNSAIPEDILIIEEYIEELNLPSILELRSILIILFKFVKREVAFDLIQDGLAKEEVNIDTFELCVLQDEEISIYLYERILNDDNVKKYYIEIALTKKYFKLA